MVRTNTSRRAAGLRDQHGPFRLKWPPCAIAIDFVGVKVTSRASALLNGLLTLGPWAACTGHIAAAALEVLRHCVMRP